MAETRTAVVVRRVACGAIAALSSVWRVGVRAGRYAAVAPSLACIWLSSRRAQLALDSFCAAERPRPTRRTAGAIFGARLACSTERTNADPTVLARRTLRALGLRRVGLGAGTTCVTRDAIHANLIAAADLAERGVFSERALAADRAWVLAAIVNGRGKQAHRSGRSIFRCIDWGIGNLHAAGR